MDKTIEKEITLELDGEDYDVIISVNASSEESEESSEYWGSKVKESYQEWVFDLEGINQAANSETKELVKDKTILKKLMPKARDWVSENYYDLVEEV